MKPGFISGLRHCHVPDVHSYVISDRISPEVGMVRVFHCVGESLSALTSRNGDFSLAPHNHRQDIRLIHIGGSVMNVSMAIDRRRHGRDQYEYGFKSELSDDGMGVQFKDTVFLNVAQILALQSHDVTLAAADVHTVVAAPQSAWVVIEGKASTKPSLCYSNRNDLTLSSDGLYIRMSPAHLDGVQWIYEMAMEALR